ncbi:MAG TPA: ornithine carbamoyltransferase [Bacteroidota bacterium]|jgi:ornithine carbamoyltransferase|nr:ornithine carbamoyltransferase [Bacteroidota bacterium]
MKKDFISLTNYSREEIEELFSLTTWIKEKRSNGFSPLAHKTAALIFEKPSLRTLVSFEVGIAQLGGQSVYLSQQSIGLATRESVRDVAEVLSRYNDLIVARTMQHATVEELGEHATIPVINALTDLLHPCQIMADVYTLIERNLLNEQTKIAFIGDGNNVVNSWLELAEKLPFHFVLACPHGYAPDKYILEKARVSQVSKIEIVSDPYEAAEGADVLYTDVWVSMGQEEERAKRFQAFQGYRVDANLLRAANKECVVMHCLPAHRGEEITADVLEGNQSIVLQQAENRLHVQKAIMSELVGARRTKVVEIMATQPGD